MRFLVDMPLSPDLATWLRAEGHDAVHASAISLYRASDAEILRIAAEQDHVIITALARPTPKRAVSPPLYSDHNSGF
jgi:predicted nuclease of predicted toxin-antitoxin system